MIEIDVTYEGLDEYVQVMQQAPIKMQSELASGLNEAAFRGVTFARTNAPKLTRALMGSIDMIEEASIGRLNARYGTQGIIYARMREHGGTIYPKRGKYLVFPGRDGGLVFARSVTQSGNRYMGRSYDSVRPIVAMMLRESIARAFG